MNTTYILQDGGKITATCAIDFITQLREGSRFDSDCTNQEYMNNFADRYHDLNGSVVRADTPEHFVDDLLTTGYMTIE